MSSRTTSATTPMRKGLSQIIIGHTLLYQLTSFLLMQLETLHAPYACLGFVSSMRHLTKHLLLHSLDRAHPKGAPLAVDISFIHNGLAVSPHDATLTPCQIYSMFSRL